MAQFTVRNLEDDVKARLKRRAARNKRSMEEVRHILRNAVKESSRTAGRLGYRIAARFARTGLKADLPELRGGAPRAPDLGR